MMERLRRQPRSGDPTLAFAARLLAAVEPRRASPEERARIRAEVQRRRRKRSRFVLRAPVLAAALVLVLLGAASARWGGAIARRLGSAWRAPTASPRPAPPPSPPASNRVEARAPIAPVAPNPTARPIAPPAAPRPKPRRESPRVTLTADANESDPLGDAFRALRRDSDPRTAAALLDLYLAQHPHGALGEEALALRIEAAAALGETERMARLAADYLQRFPAGRFRELASRARVVGH